jgi:hypothetical protein
MKLIVSTLALGLGACLVVAVGIFGAVEVGLLGRRVVGREYEMWVFGGAVMAVAGMAWGLYRWQDAVLGWLSPLVGGTAPEVMFCQTCGAQSRHDVSFCPRCGGTRFGIAKPDAAGRGVRWPVQVGMDVFASDGLAIGVIKRKRAKDFLVARPLKRDVYVPLAAIARADKATVHLTVTESDPAVGGWSRPDLRPGSRKSP